MLQALRFALCLTFVGLTLILPPNQAQANDTTAQPAPSSMEANNLPTADPLTISLIPEESHVLPGHPFWIGVHIKMDEHWHAYWKNPGAAGMAPVIAWNLPQGFSTGNILWPTPQRFDISSMVGFGYENEFTILVQIIPPSTYPSGLMDIGADVRWLACSDTACLPGETQTHLQVAVANDEPLKDPEQKAFFIKARALIPQPKHSITVQRKNNLIEISFEESTFIKKADFFPEHPDGIDYNLAPVFETQPNKHHRHTLALVESTPLATLKGILTLETSKGLKSFEIDSPIKDLQGKTDIVLNSNSVPKAMNDSLFDKATGEEELADISFEFQGGLLLAIGLAFVGGLLLNLMPCVLPVISFKVLSFIKMAGQSQRLILKHGLAFSGGVLLSFWVLAALLLSLQAYGRSVGWGFQLQEPIFVAILAALLFTFGLSLFGLFEMGTSLISAASQAQQKTGQGNALFGSFLSGILATAVATPCTGPFLGSAVGFAVTLPAYQALLIFTSLGVGMSLPYLLLAAFPSLLRFLPKPGGWMVTFKELMGFFMIATVLWLLWVFSAQTGTMALILMLGGLFLLAVAGWVYGKWSAPLQKRLVRNISTVLAAFIFLSGGYLIVTAANMPAEDISAIPSHERTGEIADAWEPFSPKRVAELRKKGVPVFIDFTSKWCLICQANHMILTMDEVSEKFGELGVVKMKADWTKKDEVITAELRKFGRNSVPLYVLYGADEKAAPQILPQVLTQDAVLSSLEKIEIK